MGITAKAFKYGDDINTDYIISGKYKFKSNDMKAMAVHAMEELDPHYFEKVSENGGFLVAGKNFGMGSSREQAPLVLINSDTKAVIAKSFARIFYRNAINTGLPVVICDTDSIDGADMLDLDLAAGVIHNVTQGTDITFSPLPGVMAQLLADGGLAAHFRKHGGFNL
ncbi:MAG: 3-isopropylmalate dehydratase [Coriobacteriia bacterium]|nr:3-isopropylmalate dehydratase [Coriobacteriia bacterium]